MGKPLEHYSERDRNELQRSTVALNLIVAGLEERIEPAQWHLDAAAQVPTELVRRPAAEPGDVDCGVVHARATDQIRSYRLRGDTVDEIARHARKVDVAPDSATLGGELVVRSVDTELHRLCDRRYLSARRKRERDKRHAHKGSYEKRTLQNNSWLLEASVPG